MKSNPEAKDLQKFNTKIDDSEEYLEYWKKQESNQQKIIGILENYGFSKQINF